MGRFEVQTLPEAEEASDNLNPEEVAAIDAALQALAAGEAWEEPAQ